MQFFHDKVLLSESRAPEEILSSITGGFGNWQIAVVTVGVISQLMNGLDMIAVKYSAPETLNYTCTNGSFNGSQCLNINGSKCNNFTFVNPYNVTTFTERLQLVCENERYTVWVKNYFHLGMLVGYVVAGFCTDKLGLKITAAIFISMQSLTGLLITSVGSIEMLITFVLTHGLFHTAIDMIPILAVCDVVGNKWRTIALGIVNFNFATAFVIFPYFYLMFYDISAVIGTVSILPLILLIPLLFYKDSPNYIYIKSDFNRGEESLRYIANINKCPMSPRAKLRPVQILICFILGQPCTKETFLFPFMETS